MRLTVWLAVFPVAIAIAAPPVFPGGQLARLVPSDGVPYQYFATRGVAIRGSTALVGAWGASDFGPGSGAAYLFDARTGQELAKLFPADPAPGDQFGTTVSLSGSLALIGAPTNDDLGIDSGAAYLFDVTSGLQVAKLLPTDGAAGDFFGNSVSISGTLAVVGAYGDDDVFADSGSAYVFDVTTGQQVTKLTPGVGALWGAFGACVAIEGTTVVVGSPHDGDIGNYAGAAHVFDALTGQELFKLYAEDGEPSETFGHILTISGTTALVGLPKDEDHGPNSGSAYVFDLTTGQQIVKLLPDDGRMYDNFGVSVTLSGGLAIVGAMGDDDAGLNSGSVYAFDAMTGQQLTKFHAVDGKPFEVFGTGVAMDGTIVAVGVPGDDLNVGSVYTYEIDFAEVVERNGSGLNASLLTNVAAPVLGTSWDTALDAAGHAPGLAALVFYEGPADGIFLSGGELLVDVTSGLLATSMATHAGGVVPFSMAVPPRAWLSGFRLSVQGAVFGAPGYELSNALDGIVGF